jgi:L-malate glycosyltransferase
LHRKISKSKTLPIYIKAPVVLISSWLFQGFMYMDRTERILKILLEIVFLVPIILVLYTFTSSFLAIPTGLIISHTLNWLINSHPFAALRLFGLGKKTKEEFISYADGLRERILAEKSLIGGAFFGSLSREQLTSTSDLDVRIIRDRGLSAALRSSGFLIKERFLATLKGFPLDIYLLDGVKDLSKLSEEPIIVHDPKGLLRDFYT